MTSSTTTLHIDSLAITSTKAVSKECQLWWAKLPNPDKCAQMIQGLTGGEEEQLDDALATLHWWTNKEGGGKLMAFCSPISSSLLGSASITTVTRKNRTGKLRKARVVWQTI